MSQQNGVAVTEQTADVDWLTVTVADWAKQRLLCDEVDRLMQIRKGQGFAQKPWRFKGYDGWTCGGVRWGTREDGSIVMLSGEDAALNWPTCLAWCDNCSRVDLAVTVILLSPKHHVASEAYGMLTLEGSNTNSRTRKMSLVVNNYGGETFYIGSRASDQFGRLYDKGREMDDGTDIPEGLIWRYETEFKSYRARRIAAQMLEAAKDTTDYRQNLGETVYKWFVSRGVKPIFSTYNSMPFTTETYAKLSDDDVTLRWFSTQVAPSVKRLKKNGKEEEAKRALGILAD